MSPALWSDVLNALAQRRSEWRVGDVMRREFEVVDAGDVLDTAFARLQSCACHTPPVTSRGVLVGLLTIDNLGEFVRMQSAVGRGQQPRPA
jgi:CBS-domain-containing membrane protein